MHRENQNERTFVAKVSGKGVDVIAIQRRPLFHVSCPQTRSYATLNHLQTQLRHALTTHKRTPGTRTARDCLVELSAAQNLLGKVVAVVSPGDTGDNHGSETQGAAGATGGTCCGHGGHDHAHAHAHAHHGHAHSVDTGYVGQGCASDSGDGVRGKSAATGVPAQADGRQNDEAEEIPKALEVLRRAKAACRVAEAACLLRGGRVAQSTEVLRELLFEVRWL